MNLHLPLGDFLTFMFDLETLKYRYITEDQNIHIICEYNLVLFVVRVPYSRLSSLLVNFDSTLL